MEKRNRIHIGPTGLIAKRSERKGIMKCPPSRAGAGNVRRPPSPLIPLLLIIAGAIAITVGVLQGEALVVLKKATLICLECIGLG